MLLCSARCHTAAKEAHEAAIRTLYCGAALTTRPRFDDFYAGAEVFMEAGTASDAAWLRLAQATPQPERETPD